MSEWLYHDDYADVWQCYAHLPIAQMTAGEVMGKVGPGSGLTWAEELRHLWTEGCHDTLMLLQYVAREGISEPIVIGPDGRLWDGHHRLAVAQALNITVPARIVPSEKPIG